MIPEIALTVLRSIVWNHSDLLQPNTHVYQASLKVKLCGRLDVFILKLVSFTPKFYRVCKKNYSRNEFEVLIFLKIRVQYMFVTF